MCRPSACRTPGPSPAHAIEHADQPEVRADPQDRIGSSPSLATLGKEPERHAGPQMPSKGEGPTRRSHRVGDRVGDDGAVVDLGQAITGLGGMLDHVSQTRRCRSSRGRRERRRSAAWSWSSSRPTCSPTDRSGRCVLGDLGHQVGDGRLAGQRLGRRVGPDHDHLPAAPPLAVHAELTARATASSPDSGVAAALRHQASTNSAEPACSSGSLKNDDPRARPRRRP